MHPKYNSINHVKVDLPSRHSFAPSEVMSIEFSFRMPNIVKVIYNDPATIVFWSDYSKTVVKAGNGDEFDPEVGLAMAIAKKALGNKGNYNNIMKKWLPEEETNA